MDLTKKRADLDPDNINQAQSIIAPVLAPELAFDLALKNIFSNPTLINVLINQYGKEVHSVVAPLYIQFPYDLIADKDRPITSNSEYATYLEKKKIENDRLFELLEVFDRRGLLDKFFDHLISDCFKYPYSRSHSLYYYYQYLNKRSAISGHKPSEFLKRIKRSQEAKFISQRTDIPDLVKSEIFTAMAFIYTTGYGGKTEAPLLELAAKYFWVGVDISAGEDPAYESLKRLLYRDKFYLREGSGMPSDHPAYLASKSLWKKLDQLDFSTLDFEQKRLILLQYLILDVGRKKDVKGNITGGFPLLMPKETAALVKRIIPSINSSEEKEEMAIVLSNFPRIVIYNNIFEHDKRIAKEYIEFLVSWYEQNDGYNWQKPDFLEAAVLAFPSFKDRIDARFD